LDSYLKDTRKARELKSNHSYARIIKEGETFEAQEYFINHYTR